MIHRRAPPRMAVEHGTKLSQGSDRKPRPAACNLRAGRGIAHPCRYLARQTRPDLDVEDLTTGASLPAIDANALTVERMPGIRHDHKLRLVC
jgi:hypothetical protein